MPAAAMNNLVQKLLGLAKADPKRTGVLAVLVAVLGVMWGRMAMQSGGGPQAAGAAQVSESDNGEAGGARTRADRDSDASSAAAVTQWRSTPVSPVVRNLFTVQLDYYAQEAGRSTSSATRVDEGFWDELAKSISTQADQKKQQHIFVQNLLTQAGTLEVQTIVMGAVPAAVINGQMVGVGSVVAEFRVLKIEARRIIVEREGIKLDIPMK